MTAPSSAEVPPSLAAVIDNELEAILGTKGPAAEEARKSLWGLALSGGGIRSATFALGLLQSLAREKALGGFHYLSTVSGGGYAGAFLQGAIQRFNLEGACDLLTAAVHDDEARLGDPPSMPANRPLRHLREYSNYLSPKKAAMSGDTLGMIATYLRNVLLTQSQLLSLMLVIGLLPLCLAPLFEMLARDPVLALGLTAFFAVVGMTGLAVLSAAAQKQGEAFDVEVPRGLVVKGSVAVVVCFTLACVTGALGMFNLGSARLGGGVCTWVVSLWPGCAEIALGVNAALIYAVAWVLWFGIDVARRIAGNSSSLGERWLRFVAGSLASAVLAGALVLLLQRWVPPSATPRVWPSAIWGAPLVFVVIATAVAFQIGLVGRALSDLQRELWARVGGKSGALVIVGVCGSLGLVILGPWVVGHFLLHEDGLLSRVAGWSGVGSWALVSIAGVLATARTGETRGNRKMPGWLRRALISVAPMVFVLGLWVAIGLLGQGLLHWLGASAFPARDAAASLPAYLASLSALASSDTGLVWRLLLAAGLLWGVLSLTMDANELSLNAFYRNRLVRCYLGATNPARNAEPVTNFDPDDDVLLDELSRPGKPRPLFPLIGAAMNWVSSKQLDWQDRRAASFLLSPLYCGYLPPSGRTGAVCAGDRGLRRDDAWRLAKEYKLGTAIAMSGAAVSPNMGVRSSPAVTFLLTLFDARLGWWVPNRMQQRIRQDRPRFPGIHLISELLGITHGLGRFAHVSDGGHFENLGLYELVRRGCRFILCSDAGADPRREFADLGNAIQKCRVDFGAEIEIDVADLRPDPATGLSRKHATLGKITYADGSQGLLLYLKPSLLGDEPADIHNYSRQHPEFPHEPTVDQYFDEAQFECYRRLGVHIASNVIGPLMARADAKTKAARVALDTANTPYKEHFLQEAVHHLYDPADAISQHFSKHGETIAQLFATLRSNPGLAVLDAQFHPGWLNATATLRDKDSGSRDKNAGAAHRSLPKPEDFRACFYFCLELIQLMESVYLDLDLETNWNHPDNRGWMNVFRHWSWAPIFRVAWAMSSQTFGARFVSFCENRVGIPSVVDALEPEMRERLPGESMQALADRLLGAGEINFAEAGILRSDALAEAGDISRVWLLKLRWKWMLARPDPAMQDLTLGMAVMADETLAVFRIQDHVRRLGLGGEFMRLLLARQAVARVHLPPGHYGVVGVLHGAEREAIQREIDRMFRDAKLRRRAETASSVARQARGKT